jgi:hypothetical protein
MNTLRRSVMGIAAAIGVSCVIALPASASAATTASPSDLYGYGPYSNQSSCVIAENHYQGRIEVPCFLGLGNRWWFEGDPQA